MAPGLWRSRPAQMGLARRRLSPPRGSVRLRWRLPIYASTENGWSQVGKDTVIALAGLIRYEPALPLVGCCCRCRCGPAPCRHRARDSANAGVLIVPDKIRCWVPRPPHAQIHGLKPHRAITHIMETRWLLISAPQCPVYVQNIFMSE